VQALTDPCKFLSRETVLLSKNIIVPEKISSFGCKGSKITDHHHDE
jgi:hypothetical protein